MKTNINHLKSFITRLTIISFITLLLFACNSTKRVPNGKQLLMKNEVVVDDKKTNDEEVINQLYQKPNSSILGYRLRLNLFNLAKKNSDSSYTKWLEKNPNTRKTLTKILSEKQVKRLGKSFIVSGFDNFLKKTGEAPVLLDTTSIRKSNRRLKQFYFDKGFFDVTINSKADSIATKKAKVNYTIKKGKPYLIDSLSKFIETPALDSLFEKSKNNSFIKQAKQYALEDIDNERTRITQDFRNNGAFFFQKNYITHNIDTINTSKKANLKLIIKNQLYRENDTLKTKPFKLYTISKVNIYTDVNSRKNQEKIKDSAFYNGFNLYSYNKLKYKPKAITNAVFISPNAIYSDENDILTKKLLNNLKVFNSPTISYQVDANDDSKLISNIYLQPRKKYTFSAAVDFTHSNIQDFGISGNTSVGIRNVFNGAETFQLGFRGNIGASSRTTQILNPDNTFFNISEIGIDARLLFPRFLFPVTIEKIIPKKMIPSTLLSVGYATQKNIGLDKQNFTSTFNYNWTPSKSTTARLDLLNIQFVKNVNVRNYFNIYQSSYNSLNNLAIAYNANPQFFNDSGNLKIDEGTDGFINQVLTDNTNALGISTEDLKTVRSINERKIRLTEDNLIFATNFSYTKTSKKDIYDKEFYAYKAKIESAGNFLNVIANISKKLENQSGANTFFDVVYSQYIKTEFEFIKHWDLNRKKVFAIRSFAGIAIPYGNSNNIPFSRSYFAGGSNDNRAWQPYTLGPGSSGGINDFNEANLKLSFNAELRFNIFNNTNGAIFTDIGNIWNVLDSATDEKSIFNNFNSLKDIAIGTGIGLRQDFGLFVVRLDLGLKTYNPANENSKRLINMKGFGFSNTVINIGINYPF